MAHVPANTETDEKNYKDYKGGKEKFLKGREEDKLKGKGK